MTGPCFDFARNRVPTPTGPSVSFCMETQDAIGIPVDFVSLVGEVIEDLLWRSGDLDGVLDDGAHSGTGRVGHGDRLAI